MKIKQACINKIQCNQSKVPKHQQKPINPSHNKRYKPKSQTYTHDRRGINPTCDKFIFSVILLRHASSLFYSTCRHSTNMINSTFDYKNKNHNKLKIIPSHQIILFKTFFSRLPFYMKANISTFLLLPASGDFLDFYYPQLLFLELVD